jgi:methyl-accepting chemotaxis protein
MLAKRCAEAAHEVKQIITESVSTVESRSARVPAAGETMGELVSNVQRVTELVKEILLTTEEQSGGIEQASQAIA